MAKLVDTDVLLVNRANTTYQMTFLELQRSVVDKVRGGILISGEPLPAFNDNDLFLVNRGDVTHTIRFDQLKDSIVIAVPPVLNNVSLVENNPGVSPRFTDQEFTASSYLSNDGIPQSEKTIDAYVQGAILTDAQFDEPLVSSAPSADLAKKFWSNGLSVNVGVVTAAQNAFNGMVGNQSICDDNSICTWTIEGGVISGVLKFHTTENVTAEVYVDGISQGQSFTGATGFLYATCDLSQTVGIQCFNSPTQIRAVEINGNIITDNSSISPAVPATLTFAGGTDMVALATGDTVNQPSMGETVSPGAGNIWSSFLTAAQGFAQPASLGFNGSVAFNQYARTNGSSVPMVWDTSSFPFSAKLKIEADTGAPNGLTINITYDNGQIVNPVLISPNTSGQTIHETTTVLNNITRIELINSNSPAGLYQVWGDDIPFIDGQPWVSTPTGTVYDVTGTTVELKDSTGTWTNTEDVTGPSKQIVVDGTKKYLDFDSDGNVLSLLDAPQSPAYVTAELNPGLTFEFPSTFPSGLTPDEELGDGVTLTVTVKAENGGGVSGPLSATVQPEPTPVTPANLAGLVTLYTGNNTSNRNIVNGVDNATEGGLIWIKDRDTDNSHWLYDTKRGVNSVMLSNSSVDEQPSPPLNSFNSNGFGIGNTGNENVQNRDYVVWNWNQAPNYFTMVQYTGNNDNNQTITHSLGTKPGLVITKDLMGNNSWTSWHVGLTDESYYITLDDASPEQESVTNSWTITDTTFNAIGSVGANIDSRNYIAYLFAEDTPNVIKCGSYTGAGPGTSVTDVGFTPQWLLVRRTEVGDDWMLFDNKRGVNTGNPAESEVLNPNNTAQGRDSQAWNVQFNATGFTFTGFDNGTSAVGGQYVYMAIAEPPAARSLTAEELEAQKLQFATYENRKMVNCGQQAQAKRDTLRTSLISAGYSNIEIADIYLSSYKPVAINGYYPLFETIEDANAAGNGTSHSHIVDDVTYYMPDGGVTIYHGNYEESPSSSSSGSGSGSSGGGY